VHSLLPRRGQKRAEFDASCYQSFPLPFCRLNFDF